MKIIRMNLDEIGGVELTQKDKALFKGGDEGLDCPVMCQLWDFEGDLGPPACCPWPDPFTCIVEIESYYRSLTPPTYLYASCWEVNGGEQ